MGRMPETWQGLLEEKDRVLHWSSEVLARVQDNVTNEDTFLMDYDDDKVDAKIDTWIKTNQTRVDETFNKFANASDVLRNVVKTGIEKVINFIFYRIYTSVRIKIFRIKQFKIFLKLLHIYKIRSIKHVAKLSFLSRNV